MSAAQSPHALLAVHNRAGLLALARTLKTCGYHLIAPKDIAVHLIRERVGVEETAAGYVREALKMGCCSQLTHEQALILLAGWLNHPKCPIEVVVCDFGPITLQDDGGVSYDIVHITLVHAAALAGLLTVADQEHYGKVIEFLRNQDAYNATDFRLATARDALETTVHYSNRVLHARGQQRAGALATPSADV